MRKAVAGREPAKGPTIGRGGDDPDQPRAPRMACPQRAPALFIIKKAYKHIVIGRAGFAKALALTSEYLCKV